MRLQNLGMESPHTPTIYTAQPYPKHCGYKEMDALSSRSVLIVATTEREKSLGLISAGSVNECDLYSVYEDTMPCAS